MNNVNDDEIALMEENMKKMSIVSNEIVRIVKEKPVVVLKVPIVKKKNEEISVKKEEKNELEYINERIKREICYETIKELTDENLMPRYKECKSVKNKIKILSDVLGKYVDEEETKQKIIQEYFLEAIPPGTKGVIRGNKFNTIVKQFILNLALNEDLFEICFEKNCEGHFTTEIPDWYILEKSTNKIIIGMNQLDLWGGGQQLNRGFKYLTENNNEQRKLLCVVCNEIQLKSKNKAYELFKIGFDNNTLCYLNNLKNIITSYFN